VPARGGNPNRVADLTLGPLLRYVDGTSATVWVEAAAPGTVTVRCDPAGLVAESPTFTVHGHHYALVVVEGLEPGGSYPYAVLVNGTQVWPEPDSEFPASRIRTVAPDRPLRLMFGSCRNSAPHDPANLRSHGVDVLRSHAYLLARVAEREWPSLLLLLGDQVYADEPPPEMAEFLRHHRNLADRDEPDQQVIDFAEYAELYRLAWIEPALRWLLSTIPTAMVFDDHELRDDWNISAAWREQMRAHDWWQRQVTAGLGAYWIYQHLGNLAPAELAADPILSDLRAAGGDSGKLLDGLAWPAGSEAGSYRWSYTRDYGRVRIVVLDTRCARVLGPERRLMLAPGEWEWFDRLATGDLDHLVVGSSLPVLLPVGLHQLEGWNEAVCGGAWGGAAARPAEWLRQAVDLGHWGAFRASFDALAGLVAELAAGRRGDPPASLLFLSGDVHYSYLAQAWPPGARTAVYQVVCSPIRNPLNRTIRFLNGFASTRLAGVVGRLLARTAGVPAPAYRWRVQRGPFFHNALATLDLAGRTGRLRFHAADHSGGQTLRVTADRRLS